MNSYISQSFLWMSLPPSCINWIPFTWSFFFSLISHISGKDPPCLQLPPSNHSDSFLPQSLSPWMLKPSGYTSVLTNTLQLSHSPIIMTLCLNLFQFCHPTSWSSSSRNCSPFSTSATHWCDYTGSLIAHHRTVSNILAPTGLLSENRLPTPLI